MDVCFVISIFCLPFCVCVCLHTCTRSIEEMLSSRALPCYPITAHHSYAFSTAWGGLAVWRLTHKQTNKRLKSESISPLSVWVRQDVAFNRYASWYLWNSENWYKLVQNFMCYVGRRPTQPIPQPILHILGCSSPLVQLDCFSYNLLK